jgi:threonylcarbamoyladenosine tRNA methylthiotransferase MtaB
MQHVLNLKAPKKVAITTLGCKLNQYDSEVILSQFRADGYEISDDSSNADICVVNSCAVTASAERKTRSLLRSLHRRNPHAVVLAVGCVSERAPESLTAIQGVSAVIGNSEKQHILDFLPSAQDDKPARIFVGETKESSIWTDGLAVDGLRGRTRSYLKVQDGCSQKCTYCVIPRLRGVGRSLRINEAVQRAERLVDKGFTEIVITGVALGTFGFDLDLPEGLTALLRALEKVAGLRRIRLGSIEPWALTDDFLRLAAESECICPHLHIPLQSCENSVLRRMNRRYSVSDVEHILDCAFSLRSDWGIGSDIIAGFPGEGRDEFGQTENFLLNSPISYLHVFPFSSRPGTPAAKLPSHVSDAEKHERVATLRCVDETLRQRFRRSNLGKTLNVLFEQRHVGSLLAGHAPNYLDVFADASESLAGSIHQVRITNLHADGVVGEIISQRITAA